MESNTVQIGRVGSTFVREIYVLRRRIVVKGGNYVHAPRVAFGQTQETSNVVVHLKKF